MSENNNATDQVKVEVKMAKSTPLLNTEQKEWVKSGLVVFAAAFVYGAFIGLINRASAQ